MTTNVDEQRLNQIRQRVANRNDSNALESACGEYNCTCHYDIDFLLSLIDSQVAELVEEKRLRAELKRIARIGIQEVSSVGTRLQECAVRDTTERVSLAMRDKCVATLRQIAADYDNVAQPNNGAAISKQAVLYAARQIESLPLAPASGDSL